MGNSRWLWAPQFTPPFHIAADGYGDLGAGFVDVNEDRLAGKPFEEQCTAGVAVVCSATPA